MRLEVVAATEPAFVAVYGHRPEYSMQGFVGMQDGEPRAVAGIYTAAGQRVMFLRTKGKVSPRLVVLLGRAALDLARACGSRVYAIRDAALPTAGGLLTHFGFQPVGETAEGEVYLWQQ